ncbi:hypothetical protein Ddye_005498 [Dipteronia dyeriana]|uniref:Ubiquitin-like protease family profile domain-containing protein n=1 Tax=Dipteronia dyeriana TaxID=168575 RepID=A0AAD9XGB1_9ROSI|nr:hypothetical protein Ddye_005498 [Dipteronia dyeriana]
MHASVHWRIVIRILFPTNGNGNHGVSVEVNLKERVIKVFDSKSDVYSVDQILKWVTCLRKMLPSLLAYAMPDTYTDPSSFIVERSEESIPHQGNQYVFIYVLIVMVYLLDDDCY